MHNLQCHAHGQTVTTCNMSPNVLKCNYLQHALAVWNYKQCVQIHDLQCALAICVSHVRPQANDAQYQICPTTIVGAVIPVFMNMLQRPATNLITDVCFRMASVPGCLDSVYGG